jgi:hypothetical protein
MEAWWILVLVGGRAPFYGVRVKVCWGGTLAVAPRSIISPRIHLHLDSDVEKVVGVVRFLNASSDCGDLRIIKELHQ